MYLLKFVNVTVMEKKKIQGQIVPSLQNPQSQVQAQEVRDKEQVKVEVEGRNKIQKRKVPRLKLILIIDEMIVGKMK